MIHALTSGTASLLAQAPAIPAVPAAPAAPGFSVTFWVLLAIAGLIGFILLIVISQYIQLAVQAWLSGASVSILKLVMMRLRKVNPS